MKTLTVFTPTYNRAHLLPRLYESLCRQTSKDFLWMVIDDGSSDNTKELLQQWMEENNIEIQYHYKENGGMHTGHNAAYRLIQTELNVCIDSDDYMPDDAVVLILNKWNSIRDKTTIAGIIGLDADTNGKIIGTKIPKNLTKGSLMDLYNKHQVKGDKKLVLRTDIVREYPEYPEYEGEKLVPLGILYMMMGKDYDFVYKNEVYCIVEYQEDGSTKNILKQYKRHPNGFAFSRVSRINYEKTFKEKFKNAVHLVSSAIFAKDSTWLFKSNFTGLVILALPFGLILNLFIRFKI